MQCTLNILHATAEQDVIRYGLGAGSQQDSANSKSLFNWLMRDIRWMVTIGFLTHLVIILLGLDVGSISLQQDAS